MKTIGQKIESERSDVAPGAPAEQAGWLASPSHRKPATVSEGGLSLPKSALVVMRKSGGARFSARTVTVRRDGRIVRSIEAGAAGDADDRQRASRKRPVRLTKPQLSQLRILLAQSRLGQASARGAQPPDGYAYEIVGRVGRSAQSAEVFDGNIPAAMQPLIRMLNGCLG